jgi:hypothetical protein
MMRRTTHLGALAAPAGALVAVGLLVPIMLVMVEARSAGAPLPGEIVYVGLDTEDPPWDTEIYTINVDERGEEGRFNVTDNNNTFDLFPSWGSPQ